MIDYMRTNTHMEAPPRKKGLTPKTTEVRVVCFAIIQAHQYFSELAYSSLKASISRTKYKCIFSIFNYREYDLWILFILKYTINYSTNLLNVVIVAQFFSRNVRT